MAATATAPATLTKAPAAKRRTRKQKSDLQGRFEGLVKLVNEQKLINQLANKLNLNPAKAKVKLFAIVNRVGKSDGLVSKRSQEDVELIFTTILEMKPSVQEFVDDIRQSITYRSNKTGKRDNSWIRDLLAGVPRKEDGKFKAYIEISPEKAKKICEEMGIELPEDEETPELPGEDGEDTAQPE